MISFLNIGSGSKGNATLIYNEDSLILVDMGLPRSSLKAALDEINRPIEDILGVLITHNHDDHIRNLKTLHNSYPIYAGKEAILDEHIGVNPTDSFSIGSFDIIPLRTSHDAPDSFGYLFISGDERLLYMTDTGRIPNEDLPYMKDCDYYILESNYDVWMLMHSKRPIYLKRRIKGDYGHLSNKESALHMSSLIGEHTKKIYLAHLSEECNTAEKAKKTYKKIFKEKGVTFSIDNIITLKQHEMTFGGDEE